MRQSDSFLRRRRDSTRVIYEILSNVDGGVSKTKVVYRANLNFRLAESYIKFLVAKGHLRRESINGHVTYGLTDKGTNFRRLLGEVERELVEFFP